MAMMGPYQYVLDLGLIRNDRGVLRPANPIYGEVIARTLNLENTCKSRTKDDDDEDD